MKHYEIISEPARANNILANWLTANSHKEVISIKRVYDPNDSWEIEIKK